MRFPFPAPARPAAPALALAVLLAASFAAPPAFAAEYTLDPGHTQVRFGWSHFGFSMPEANFNEVTGTLEADDKEPEKAVLKVKIPVSSLDTHVPALNEHLLTEPGFFKPKQFPFITFDSSKVANIADQKHFDVIGTLTVNGIAKEVTLHATLEKLGPHPMFKGAEAAGFLATTTIKRSDFGMGAYAPDVSDEMRVRITAEAIDAKAFAAREAERAAEQKDPKKW